MAQDPVRRVDAAQLSRVDASPPLTSIVPPVTNAARPVGCSPGGTGRSTDDDERQRGRTAHLGPRPR